jgi:hypothetical protein
MEIDNVIGKSIDNGWWKDTKNVLELAVFLFETEQITNDKELYKYLRKPQIWGEVWYLYEREIMGYVL